MRLVPFIGVTVEHAFPVLFCLTIQMSEVWSPKEDSHQIPVMLAPCTLDFKLCERK